MTDFITFSLGILPLLALIIMILVLKLPIHHSILLALALTLILGVFAWHNSWQSIGIAAIYGALKGLWPIVIVILGAIFSYNLMLKTGSMDVIKDLLAGISHDQRIQVLLISWCFGGFLEAVAGYGTAVAIPISILVALGFDPIKAAVASLVANTVPTAFGAVGIPVSILAEQTNLPVLQLSATVILQLAIFNLLLPFVIVAIAGGGLKAIRGVFWITLLCGIATLVPQYLVAAHLGAELPAFAGSLVSLLVVILLAKKFYRGTEQANAKHYSFAALFKAGVIYLLTFIFILACSPLFPAFKAMIGQFASTFTFPINDGTALKLKLEWISTPGILIIIASYLGGLIQGASVGQISKVLIDTIVQLKNSIIAIMAIVALATVMDVSGMISDIAQYLVAITGSAYVFIAPVIGALGTFVTGSDTNSNVLFGKLQTSAAHKLQIDPLILAAANTAGATGGKMISPQSIAIAVSATQLDGKSGTIMSSSLKYCVLYIVVLGLEIGLSYFLL